MSAQNIHRQFQSGVPAFAVATSDGEGYGRLEGDAAIMFVTVTSSNADHIVHLPPPVPGRIVILHNGATGYELRAHNPAVASINGNTPTAGHESAIGADRTCVMICVSETAWKGFAMDADSDLAKVEAAA
jgi:hypothetical protein